MARDKQKAVISSRTLEGIDEQSDSKITHVAEKKMNDIRRYVNGVRVTAELGGMLSDMARALRALQPTYKMKNREFADRAINLLSSLGIIELIDPAVAVPNWLCDDDKRFVRWGKSRPAWVIRIPRLDKAVRKAIEELDPWRSRNSLPSEKDHVLEEAGEIASILLSNTCRKLIN